MTSLSRTFSSRNLPVLCIALYCIASMHHHPHQVVAELTGAKKPGDFDDAYIPPVARSSKRK